MSFIVIYNVYVITVYINRMTCDFISHLICKHENRVRKNMLPEDQGYSSTRATPS